MNNSTLLNTNSTHAECSIDRETVFVAWFALGLITSIVTFVGSILLIVVIYRTRTIRTSTDYFVVNMAASGTLFTSLDLFYVVQLLGKADYLSQTTGTLLCKFIGFFWCVSYEVSILSLVVIAGYRFYAVAFPMPTRVQSRRSCIILLLFTWVLPIAVSIPVLFFTIFKVEHQYCFGKFSIHQSHILLWDFLYLSSFFLLPLLVMLVLYPVIIVKLRQQKILGNATCSQAVMAKWKQNFRLMTMFLTITVAFILCWGTDRVMYLIYSFSLVTDWCTIDKVDIFVVELPLVFHAINPVIYFIFCSSYRKEIKQLLSCCCCHTHLHYAPDCDQMIELGNIPQV